MTPDLFMWMTLSSLMAMLAHDLISTYIKIGK